jgi:MiaB/RimO family radical SAM methylthiotransferase
LQKLINLGCKLNQYEGYCLLEAFSGVENLVIVNTCCVTREAELHSQKKFRQACRQFPDATIIATGCACRTNPEKFKEAKYLIDNVDRNTTIIVAKVRARVESKTIEEIQQEMSWAISLGHKEVVLVGANIGLYGTDTGTSLDELLTALGRMPNCPRIRLSSIEPFFITPQLIEAMKQISACRHFHIPIQSADDVILKQMNRTYDSSYLRKAVEMIHKNFQDVAIGADVIVGFPGEGDKEFQNTYMFLKEKPFTHLHVFPYSPRLGTEAYALGDPVPKAEKKNRLWELKKLIRQKHYEFRQRLLNKKFMVTVEQKEERCCGLTDNYIRVDIDGQCAEKEMLEVSIDAVTEDRTHAVRESKDTAMH